ncbi:MAG: DUF4870 domain-containing protein [Planctomycetes bacterium]|nr:DUF4870 domain-containing protein [Planctomycetota bacterium]
MSQNPSQSSIPSGIDADTRSYATYTHLVPLLAHLGGPIVLPILAAIIMWQMKKGESPFLDDHGREATNFQISMAIYAAVLIPLLILVTCGIALILAIPAAILLFILNIVGCILAAKAAHRGEYYRYPMSIRIV